MKHLHVITERLREGIQAGPDPLGPGPVSPGADSRPNSAPAYYQGRPACLWINAMKPRRKRQDRDSARQSGPAGDVRPRSHAVAVAR